MSEPLNIFLEDVEVAVRMIPDDDAELGRVIRIAWKTLLEKENTVTSKTYNMIRTDGKMVKVVVTENG